ncbi:hypothetical protein [Methylomicrobium agile]|uniref:hypothetical protein n=1 Tax=Methylomicrobium agile TaxID=39774 RepID=UPI0004DFA2F9|nr:hypothetical protein [Methylomicrobium agile]
MPNKPIGGYRRAILEPYADALVKQLAQRPSMTLKKLQSWLETGHRLTLSITTLVLPRHGINGRLGKKAVISPNGCFWMKPESAPICSGVMAGL